MGRRAREATRTSVVFPEPFGRIGPTPPPALTETLISWTTGRPSYPAVTASSAIGSVTGPGLPALPPEEIKEERPSEKGGDRADRDLLGRSDGPGCQVGQHHEHRSSQDRGGEEPAVIRSEEQPEQV